MSAPAASAPSDLLAFFQLLFPEEIYAFGTAAAPATVAPELAAAAPVSAAPPPTPAPPQPSRPAALLAIAELPVAPVAPIGPPISTFAVSSPEPVPVSPTPAFVSGTTHQQSRGDGSGAVVVQRIPAADAAKLNQNEFWQNFLKFLGLDWPTVRFVNVLTNDPLPLPELLASAPGATRLLLFGSGLVSPLPPEAPAYDLYALPDGGPTLLRAHAVTDLTPERKKLLLLAVKAWKK